MTWYQRICPHWFGWSYNTHRRRRWCRVCGQQQRLNLEPLSGAEITEARRLEQESGMLAMQRYVLARLRGSMWVDA